jgi:hypothetical protein
MRLAFLLVLVVLAAGCFGGNSSDPEPGTGTTTTSRTTPIPTTPPTGPAAPTAAKLDLLLNFDLAPCIGVQFQAFEPLAEIQALLPPGYEAIPTTRVPGNMGVLAADFYSCQNLTTPFVNVPKTYYGQTYTFVKQPTGTVFTPPTATVHEYVFRVLAGEDILAVLWRAAGYDVYNGSFVAASSAPVPGLPTDPGVRSGQASVGQGYFAQGSGHPGGIPGAASTQPFARYTVLADNSTLVWNGTYQVSRFADGEGFLQVPANDTFNQFEAPGGNLLGLTRLQDSGSMLGMNLRRYFPPAT